jgi:ATP-binding cassette subfamily B protein
MSHYTNDTDSLRQLISNSLTSLVQSVFMLVALLSIMLFYSIWLSIIVLVGIGAMFFVTATVGGRSAKGFVMQQKKIAETEGFVEEMLNGQKVVQVFSHEDEAKKAFDKINNELFEAQVYAESNASKMGPIMMNIGNIMYVSLAFLGGVLLALSMSGFNVYNLTLLGIKKVELLAFLPIVISFLTLARQFTNNVNQVAQQYNSIVMALAATDRIFTLIDTQEEVDNGYRYVLFLKENYEDCKPSFRYDIGYQDFEADTLEEALQYTR